MEKMEIRKTIRFGTEEYQTLMEMAGRENKTFGKYVRDVLLNTNQNKVPMEILEECRSLNQEISKTCMGINQIARMCSAAGTVSDFDYEKLQRNMNSLSTQVNGIYQFIKGAYS